MIKLRTDLPELLDQTQHHLLPVAKSLAKNFIDAGFNLAEKELNKFEITIRWAEHRILHGHWNDIHGLGLNWNRTWKLWFEEQAKLGIKVDKQMVMNQLKKMMSEAGLAEHWNKWVGAAK
jgi:hypothetical protein